MKRFWLVLLSLGLVMAFSASVFAADVKFSGSYYAAGMYQDKTTFYKDTSADGPSTAFYYQRLRVNMEFIATPALKLITRFDALERVWGGARSTPGTVAEPGSSGTRAENENIAFDNAYIYYVSPIGLFTVGYQDDSAWGTKFADNTTSVGKITYMFVKMPIIAGLQITKVNELSNTAYVTSTTVDRDTNKYVAYGIFNWTGGQVGLLGFYQRVATNRILALGSYQTNLFGLMPYAKAKIGPVAIEAEVDYYFGKLTRFEAPSTSTDSDISQWAAYIDALADFGMFYAGGTAAYVSGDDPTTLTTSEGGLINGGADWNPCLIMFNWDRFFWAGTIPGYPVTNVANTGGSMVNAWFGQIRGGVRPIAQLDIGGSVAYAKADTLPTGYLDKSYGWEVDVTATYKITNNLSYMLGVGYLFTGDYYKGTSAANNVDNNYLVINKLTLTF